MTAYPKKMKGNVTMIKPNYPGLTSEAARMLRQQYGFRTDAQSAVSITSVTPNQILNYEINELGNDDIIDTLAKLYAFHYQPDSQDNYNVTEIDNDIQQLINLQPNEAYYLLWLTADWQNCYEFYSDGHLQPKTMYDIPEGFEMPFIDVYQIHADDALISDVGADGQLIATKHEPKPMHGFNY